MGCFWKVGAAEMLALTAKSQERVHALRHLFSISEAENKSNVMIFRKTESNLEMCFCWFGHVTDCNNFKGHGDKHF